MFVFNQEYKLLMKKVCTKGPSNGQKGKVRPQVSVNFMSSSVSNNKENNKMSDITPNKIITEGLVFNIEGNNQFKPIKIVVNLSNMTYYVGSKGLLSNLKTDIFSSASNEALYYSKDAQDYVLSITYIPTMLKTKPEFSSHPFFIYLADRIQEVMASLDNIYMREVDMTVQKRIKEENMKDVTYEVVRVPHGYLAIYRYKDKDNQIYIHMKDLMHILDTAEPKFDKKMIDLLSNNITRANKSLVDVVQCYRVIKSRIKPNVKFDDIFRFLIINYSIPKDPKYNQRDENFVVSKLHKTKYKCDITTYYVSSNGDNDVYVDLTSLVENLELSNEQQIVHEFSQWLVFNTNIQTYSIHKDILKYFCILYATEFDVVSSTEVMAKVNQRSQYMEYLMKLINIEILERAYQKEEEDIYPKIMKNLEAKLIQTPYGAISVYMDKVTNNQYIHLRDLYELLNKVSPLEPTCIFNIPILSSLDEWYAGLFDIKTTIPIIKDSLPRRNIKQDEILDTLYKKTSTDNEKPSSKKPVQTFKHFKSYCKAYNVDIALLSDKDEIFVGIEGVFKTLNLNNKKIQHIVSTYKPYFSYSEELDDHIIHIDNLVQLFEINELPIFYQVKDSIINYLELLLDLVFKFKCTIRENKVSPNKSENMIEFGLKDPLTPIKLYYNNKTDTTWVQQIQLFKYLGIFKDKTLDLVNKFVSALPSHYIRYFEGIGTLLRYDDNTIKVIKQFIDDASSAPILTEIEKLISEFLLQQDYDLEDLDEELDDEIEYIDTEKGIDATSLAVGYGLSLEKFNNILYSCGFQYPIEDKNGREHWIVRSKYADQDLIHECRYWQVKNPKDSFLIKEIISFTPKGVDFIRDLLTPIKVPVDKN